MCLPPQLHFMVGQLMVRKVEQGWKGQTRKCFVNVYRQWQLPLNPPGVGFFVKVGTIADIIIPYTNSFQ